MIDPNTITTVNVGELPPSDFNLTDNIPHEISGDLHRGTVQQLADKVGDYLGTSDGLAFNPTTVNDGGTLPDTDKSEWMLVGKGTFHNVAGSPDITTTEELNAVTSNGSYWSLSVEIPINVEFAGVTQNIRPGYTSTTPSENTVYDALHDKLSRGGYNGSAQDIVDMITFLTGLNNADVAYVESNGNDSTAQIGNSRKAFLTIDAALDALPSTGGVIKIGLGDFDSPTLAKIKNGTFFIGSGKPKTNSVTTYTDQITQPTVTAPTMLVNGTVLKGTFDFSNKNSIVVKDLGVDCGSAWVTAHGGTALNALITGQVGSVPNNVGPPQKGIVVDNVSALCAAPASAVHAILIENTVNARVSNISTYYGTHGFVIKSRGINAFNIDCHGHSGEGMIVKADTYAYCSNVNVDNVYITSIGTFDGGGLMVDGGSGVLSNVNITNVNIEHTTYGITDTATSIQDISISNVSIYKTYGNGVYFNPLSKNIILNNIKQDGTQSGNGIELNSTGTNIKTISNATSKNCSFNGILLSGGNGRITASNINSDNSSVVITGNVFGENIQGTGTITGYPTLVTGPIGAKTIALGLGASNIVGAGSAVILDNGLTSGSYRAMSGQLNASNGITYWKFNGSGWIDTGIRVSENGTISAQPGISGLDLVNVNQLNASVTPGVKRYKALISQSGTSAPTAVILENSLGTVTFGYSSAATYTVNSSGLFTVGKTALYVTQKSASNGIGLNQLNGNTLNLLAQSDGFLSNTTLLIEVYP